MTVPNIYPINPYKGTGDATEFDYNFKISGQEELVVKRIDSDGNIAVLEYGTDYSITNIGNSNGGKVIFPLDTSIYDILQPDEKIYLELNLAIQQESEFRNSRYFNFDMLENTFDYIVRILQILDERLSRCVIINEGTELSTFSFNTQLERLDDVLVAVDTIQSSISNFFSEYERCLNDILSQDIVNKSSIDLDNLSTKGENHFVNYSQITNCILEVPERIKYRLVSGQLTIYAGSVIIVPYNTRQPALNIGDTLLHSNFKIVDIQYINNKLFYWVEIQQNMVQTGVSSSDRDTRLISVSLSTNTIVYDRNTYSTSNPNYTTSVTYYHTTNNEVYQTGSNGANARQLSFPLMSVVGNGSNIFGKVKEVFNGIGYIGSTIFVDKGVRGLYSNGFNKNGGLKNTEHTNETLLLYTSTTNNSAYSIFLSTNDSFVYRSVRNIYYLQDYSDIPSDVVTTGLGSLIYVANDNKWYDNNNTNHTWQQANIIPLVTATFVSGSPISDFVKKPLCRIVTTNDDDGKWVISSSLIVQNLPVGDSSTAYTASLNDYLPKDSHTYEVMLRGMALTGSSSGNYVPLYVSTSLVAPTNWYVCSARARTAATNDACGTCIILVPPDRNINITRNTSYNGTVTLSAIGYRRVK